MLAVHPGGIGSEVSGIGVDILMATRRREEAWRLMIVDFRAGQPASTSIGGPGGCFGRELSGYGDGDADRRRWSS